jgi:hypothetical protein
VQALLNELTLEQEAQIASYRDKWRTIALCTDRVDPQQATAVIQAAYAVVRRQPPEVVFCPSPHAALQLLKERIHPDQSLGKRLAFKLGKQFHDRLFHWFKKQLGIKVFDLVSQQLSPQLSINFSTLMDAQLEKHLGPELFQSLYEDTLNHLMPESYICGSCGFDFFIAVLNCTYDPPMWKLNQDLIQHCGWIYPYDKIAIVCDRPTHLSLDAEGFLHAVGKPAIVFSDGFCVHAHHGEQADR